VIPLSRQGKRREVRGESGRHSARSHTPVSGPEGLSKAGGAPFGGQRCDAPLSEVRNVRTRIAASSKLEFGARKSRRGLEQPSHQSVSGRHKPRLRRGSRDHASPLGSSSERPSLEGRVQQPRGRLRRVFEDASRIGEGTQEKTRAANRLRAVPLTSHLFPLSSPLTSLRTVPLTSHLSPLTSLRTVPLTSDLSPLTSLRTVPLTSDLSPLTSFPC
jgi:hypothetical protein